MTGWVGDLSLQGERMICNNRVGNGSVVTGQVGDL